MTPWWSVLRRAAAAAGNRRRRAAQDRRRLTSAGVAVSAVLAAAAAVVIVLVSVIPKPAMVTVVVAAQVLGEASEAFGDNGGELTGGDLARSAGDGGIDCDAAPAVSPVTAPAAETATAEASEPEAGTPVAVKPMTLGATGSLGRQDVETLLAPLERGTTSLRAHVWFLYRLSGMGGWDQFTAAYTAAGFADSEDSDNAPLRQVQRLNATGADVGRYRLTAAALVAAGQQTGRLQDPYPGYRDMVAVELLGSCDSASAADRMTLPAAATTPAG